MSFKTVTIPKPVPSHTGGKPSVVMATGTYSIETFRYVQFLTDTHLEGATKEELKDMLAMQLAQGFADWITEHPEYFTTTGEKNHLEGRVEYLSEIKILCPHK